jgi:hypothetical protein
VVVETRGTIKVFHVLSRLRMELEAGDELREGFMALLKSCFFSGRCDDGAARTHDVLGF